MSSHLIAIVAITTGIGPDDCSIVIVVITTRIGPDDCSIVIVAITTRIGPKDSSIAIVVVITSDGVSCLFVLFGGTPARVRIDGAAHLVCCVGARHKVHDGDSVYRDIPMNACQGSHSLWLGEWGAWWKFPF